MKIAIASDHAGFEMKSLLIEFVKEMGHEVKDYGPFDANSVDYPDYAHPLATAVENNDSDLGFALCGSGNGINITTNKHQGIRSALCWNKEITVLARQHNNANVCALPARFISLEEAKEMVEAFLTTDFEGGRHQTRINKIPCA